MKRQIQWVTAIVLLAVLAAGASGCFPFLSPSTSSNGRTTLVIRIDWRRSAFYGHGSWFTLLLAPPARADLLRPEVSTVAVRLSYPNESAVFTQSVSRQTADTQGVITMQVPSSTLANLAVVGIGAGQALSLGVKSGLRLDPGATVTVTTSDIGWVDAMWQPGDNSFVYSVATPFYDARGLTPGTLRVDIPILVRDPFESGTAPEWDAAFVGLEAGNASIGSNLAGWRQFTLSCSRPNTSTPISNCYMRPYVNGLKFGLSVRPTIPPIFGKVGQVGGEGWFDVYWPPS